MDLDVGVVLSGSAGPHKYSPVRSDRLRPVRISKLFLLSLLLETLSNEYGEFQHNINTVIPRGWTIALNDEL
jgi:hypothetical protein